MSMAGCLICSPYNHQWFGRPITYFNSRTSAVRVFGRQTPAGEGSVLQQTWTLQAIQKSGVIACLRAHSLFVSAPALELSWTKFKDRETTLDRVINTNVQLSSIFPELALETARMALDGGISVLEVTMTTPKALKVIAELGQEYPSAIIGAGTVLTYKDAKNAELAGAKFLMSPTMVKEILEAFKGGPILYVPGAMTPTEVLNAYASGAKIVKIYPVALLGGERYIRALKSPFKHIPMVASHGITLDSIELYISMGASAVVLSDAIFDRTAMSVRDWAVINHLASSATLKGATAVERKLIGS